MPDNKKQKPKTHHIVPSKDEENTVGEEATLTDEQLERISGGRGFTFGDKWQ